MSKSICFAYFADGKFIGWYADSFGSLRDAPKIYSTTEETKTIISENFKWKIKKINESSFGEAKTKVTGLAALGLAIFDSEELLRGKKVELKAVLCPIYDGPNPDFDKVAYEKALTDREDQMTKDGVFDIPAPSSERTKAVDKYPYPQRNNWIYADRAKVKEWAAIEPTEFLYTIEA